MAPGVCQVDRPPLGRRQHHVRGPADAGRLDPVSRETPRLRALTRFAPPPRLAPPGPRPAPKWSPEVPRAGPRGVQARDIGSNRFDLPTLCALISGPHPSHHHSDSAGFRFTWARTPELHRTDTHSGPSPIALAPGACSLARGRSPRDAVPWAKVHWTRSLRPAPRLVASRELVSSAAASPWPPVTPRPMDPGFAPLHWYWQCPDSRFRAPPPRTAPRGPAPFHVKRKRRRHRPCGPPGTSHRPTRSGQPFLAVALL
jgi:hypothetical protein